jgi:hypothetical protein
VKNASSKQAALVPSTGNQTIRITAPGQEGSHTFSKHNQLGPEQS